MKGIIIAAGYGTRFLPCTKTVPKEMFPLIDKPAIEFIIDEFISSGIKEILIVTSRRKKVLDDYFDREVELEGVLQSSGKKEQLEILSKYNDMNIYFLRQKEMKGTGHAILSCKDFIGNSPFVVAYPDDLVFSDIPLSKQLIDTYNRTGDSILSVQRISGDVSRYGVIDPVDKNVSFTKVRKLIEKPTAGTEPSKLISVGRYLFTPELLSLLENNFKNHLKGEFYHVDSINELASKGKVSAIEFEGERIDVGDKSGYLEGIIRYSLMRDDLKEDSIKLINKLYKEINGEK